MILSSVIRLLEKSEGRDKLAKTTIYCLKLIDSIRSIRNKIPTFALEKIANRFQHARRLFRLGKFLNELNEVRLHLKENTTDEFCRMMNVLTKLAFSIYWILDNLQMLSQYGFVNIPAFQVEYYSMTAKFIALILALLLDFRNMVRMHHEQIRIRKTFPILRHKQNLDANEKVHELVEKQRTSILMYVKIVGDMLPSIARSLFARKILSFSVPKIVQSIGGLASAIASCYLTL